MKSIAPPAAIVVLLTDDALLNPVDVMADVLEIDDDVIVDVSETDDVILDEL